jgi:ATP-binding cassette subfamily B protein
LNAPQRHPPRGGGPKPKAALGSPEAHAEEAFGGGFQVGVLGRFFDYVKPYRARLVLILLAVAGTTAASVAIPMQIRRAVNAALGRQGHAGLNEVILEFAALVAVYSIGAWLQQWLSARLAQKVIFDLRRAMFLHLQDVSLSFMDQTHVGRLMSRLQGDINSLQEFLENSVAAVGDMMLLVGIVAVLLAMDWQLGLLTLTVLPALVFVQSRWLPAARKIFRSARDASSSVNAALAENINGIRTVQESRREALNFDLFKAKVGASFDDQIKAAVTAQVMIPTVELLTGVAMAIVVIAGGESVLRGSLDVGVMVAYIFYVQQFFNPLRTLAMQYTIMQRAMTAGVRIFEVLDVPVTIKDAADAVSLGPEVEPSVEFRHVTFGYRPGHPVLHDMSFKAEPRQVVALVGPTGSGKTSTAALTHRFYDIWEGQVLVGGRDVRDVTLDSLGRTIAMVLQEPFLFTGTVMENIRYATSASAEVVEAAAKAVQAHDFIMRLPKAYETVLGQRGGNLSVGQRQLISFARALVADPRILILDEATANIDSLTELQIQNALKVLFKGRTSLVIAHRLATVRDADRIIVLQKGRIVEEGTHDDLISTRGLYAHLYTSNYASFDDLPEQTRSDGGYYAMQT